MGRLRKNGVSVLVLNQDYTPLNFCSPYRAFVLVYMDKAELVSEVPTLKLRSIDEEYPFPSIIRLKRYIYIPYRRVPLTRAAVYKRDDYECAYCGSKKNLTIDHILPRSRGGKDTWTNLITACEKCNMKKGNRTPEEAGMKLRKKPYRPSFFSFILKSKKVPEDWKPYFSSKVII